MNLILALDILEEYVQQMQFSRFPPQCMKEIYFGTARAQHSQKAKVKWNSKKIVLLG